MGLRCPHPSGWERPKKSDTDFMLSNENAVFPTISEDKSERWVSCLQTRLPETTKEGAFPSGVIHESTQRGELINLWT